MAAVQQTLPARGQPEQAGSAPGDGGLPRPDFPHMLATHFCQAWQLKSFRLNGPKERRRIPGACRRHEGAASVWLPSPLDARKGRDCRVQAHARGVNLHACDVS